jgi:hypothetical protein
VGAGEARAVAEGLPEREGRLRRLQAQVVVVAILEVAEREQRPRPAARVPRPLAQRERAAESFFGAAFVVDDRVSRGQPVQAVNLQFGGRRLLEQG